MILLIPMYGSLPDWLVRCRRTTRARRTIRGREVLLHGSSPVLRDNAALLASDSLLGWSAAKGLDVVRSPHTDADRIIEGNRIEIKFSSLWKSGVYKFQQIRDQDYDYLFCLGIAPFDAQAWVLPKALLHKHVIGSMGQHTGASGTDTAWLSFRSGSPYSWMDAYGGTLRHAFEVLQSAGRGRY